MCMTFLTAARAWVRGVGSLCSEIWGVDRTHLERTGLYKLIIEFQNCEGTPPQMSPSPVSGVGLMTPKADSDSNMSVFALEGEYEYL